MKLISLTGVVIAKSHTILRLRLQFVSLLSVDVIFLSNSVSPSFSTYMILVCPPAMMTLAECSPAERMVSIYSFSVLSFLSFTSIDASFMNAFPSSRLSGVRSFITSS